MKKTDLIIIGIIVVFILSLYGFNQWQNSRASSDTMIAKIYYDGQLIAEADLNKDQEFVVEQIGYNKVEIRDGKVYMTDADCPDQICIAASPVDGVNESIVCLPNRVHVVIEGEKEAEVDEIAR